MDIHRKVGYMILHMVLVATWSALCSLSLSIKDLLVSPMYCPDLLPSGQMMHSEEYTGFLV